MIENKLKLTDVESTIQRLLLETGSRTRTVLANRLGYSSVSAISNWNGRGIDFNRVLEVYPDIDAKYIKTGVRSDHHREEASQELSESLGHIKSHIDVFGIQNTDRDQLLGIVQSRVDMLAREMVELSKLVGVLSHFDDKSKK